MHIKFDNLNSELDFPSDAEEPFHPNRLTGIPELTDNEDASAVDVEDNNWVAGNTTSTFLRICCYKVWCEAVQKGQGFDIEFARKSVPQALKLYRQHRNTTWRVSTKLAKDILPTWGNNVMNTLTLSWVPDIVDRARQYSGKGNGPPSDGEWEVDVVNAKKRKLWECYHCKQIAAAKFKPPERQHVLPTNKKRHEDVATCSSSTETATSSTQETTDLSAESSEANCITRDDDYAMDEDDNITNKVTKTRKRKDAITNDGKSKRLAVPRLWANNAESTEKDVEYFKTSQRELTEMADKKHSEMMDAFGRVEKSIDKLTESVNEMIAAFIQQANAMRYATPPRLTPSRPGYPYQMGLIE